MAGTTVNPYRFGGQVGYRSDAPARPYVRARHLSASQGQWISRDPLEINGDTDGSYRYVGNKPTLLTDPSGLYELLKNPCGPGATSVRITPGVYDGTTVIVGPGGTMLPPQGVFPPGAAGQNCIATNGGFFSEKPYRPGKPATPIGPVYDCKGNYYPSGGEPHPPDVPIRVAPVAGSIEGRDPSKPNSGLEPNKKVPRTGACVNNAGHLVGIVASSGSTIPDFNRCLRKTCRGAQPVLLDGGGSTQVWQSRPHPHPYPGLRSGDPDRAVHNWIMICEPMNR